ncbi:MAG TPA: TolC family protein [Candidatus Acidoferrales bacterium]|nr:TolC family protein [Candidatus Acidoferrales bacterium]
MSLPNFKFSFLNFQFVAAIVSIAGATAVGQTQLDSLVTIALRNNFRIRMARYESSAAEARVSPAGTLQDPQLTIMAENVPSNFKLNSDEMTMFPQFTLMQMFPWFGKLSAAGDAQKYGYEASLNRSASTTLEVMSSLRKVYGDIYRLQASIRYVEYKRTLLGSVVRVAEQLFATGQVPQQDVFRATAEVTMARSDIINMNSMLSDSYAQLGALLGQSTPYEIQVDTLILPSLQPPASLKVRLDAKNPELSQMRNSESAANAGAAFARKDAVPDFDVGFSYGYRGASMPDGTKALNMMNFEVGFRIPIFYGARQEKMIDEADFMKQAAESEYSSVEVELSAQLRSAYADAQAQLQLMPLYARELIPQYEATYNSSLSAYSVGRTTFAMVVDNLTALINTKIELVKIEAAYFSASADISKLIGEDIEKYGGGK